MSSIKVTLGDKEYDVPKMNIGQIEDMTELDASAAKWTFLALTILMRRANPPIGDIRDIEAEPGHVREAIEKIMRGSGYNLPDSKNLQAPDRNPGLDAS
jgi:hypothetical protein